MVDKPFFKINPAPGELGIAINFPEKPTSGKLLVTGPSQPIMVEDVVNQIEDVNYTGPPGKASALYYSLVFDLPKKGWKVLKVDEWIEVSPTHKEYYERTISTKQALEATIKTGLTSAAQAVADFELMSHDLRKYKEILDYMHSGDEHSLKAMFIDQVDLHTGDGISMRSIAPRWPTIITDFMKLTVKDTDPDAIAKKLNVSKAEGVILATKSKLYNEWKTLFLASAKSRYETLRGMVEGRRKTIQEYRNWLKPYLSRFKMTKLGGERPKIRGEIMKSFLDVVGISTFMNGINVWTWRPLRQLEFRKPAAEMETGPTGQNFYIYPYDDYIRENLVLDPQKGLAALYPWLRTPRKYCRRDKKFCPADAVKCGGCGSSALQDRFLADEIVEKEILPNWREFGLYPEELYYTYMEIEVLRSGTRLPVGEIEDIVFHIVNYSVSQNVMLVKMLELKCREMELEKYIDEILGIKFENREIAEVLTEEFPKLFPKKSEPGNPVSMFFRDVMNAWKEMYKGMEKLRLPRFQRLQFIKPGPYETEDERLTEQFFTVSGGQFANVVEFLKQRMGVE